MYYRDLQEFKEASGYEIDEAWYPRVTKIMEIKAKPALYRFYAEMSSFDEGEAVKQQSASEGTLIHETVERILLGENPEISETIKPAISAFMDFYEKNRIITRPDFVERRIINKNERYAGTLDALASIGGKFGVLDLKTSQSIYRDYNIQTSAYFAALQDEFGDKLNTRWILRIDQIKKCLKCGASLRQKGGRDKVRLNGGGRKDCEHEWSEVKGEVELQESPYWREDYQAFLGAKKLWEWENGYWLRQAGYSGKF